MEMSARATYIEEQVERVRSKNIEIYYNLYPSEIKKIQKRFPDVEVKQLEPFSINRKLNCVIRKKAE